MMQRKKADGTFDTYHPKTKVANVEGAVPNTRKAAGKALSADITLAKGDVGLGNVENLSAEGVRIASTNKLRAEVKSSAPASPANGDIWYDSTNHKFQGRANGAWV